MKNNNYQTKLKKIVNGKAAVFIDAANIELSAKDLGFKIDYKKLFRFLDKNSKLVYIGFYTVRFDNKKHDGFLTILKKTGFKLITKPIKIIKNRNKKLGDLRKANFDVEIAVDALKKISQFTTIILFSGDSDFYYLLDHLKKQDKRIVVVSLKHHVSKELIEISHFYLDLQKIRKIIERK